MKLNLGCGHDRREGWVNADLDPGCEPDVVLDLESLPWPFEDDSADEVALSHVLEHVGADPKVFLGIIRELHRTCRDGARVHVVVPHPRHDLFLTDPTHVRPVTAEGLQMFSQAKNREWIHRGRANTPLGIQLGVDFEIHSAVHDLDPLWQARRERGEVSDEELRHAMRSLCNVIAQTTIEMVAVKPAGSRCPSASGAEAEAPAR